MSVSTLCRASCQLATRAKYPDGASRSPSIASSRARDERDTIPVHERLDERTSNRVGPRLLDPLAEQHRRPHRRRPHAVRAAEQRGQRLAELLLARRACLEERELPPVERLAEVRVLVCEREPLEQLAGEPPAERIEARRVPVRLRGRDRQHGLDPERPPVEPLEQHGSGGDRAARRESQRGDGVAELARRVGRPSPASSSQCSSSRQSRSVSRPNSGGSNPCASGQCARQLAVGRLPHAQTPPSASSTGWRARARPAAQRPRTRDARRRASARTRRTRARTRGRPSRSRRTPRRCGRPEARGRCRTSAWQRAPRRRSCRRASSPPPAPGRLLEPAASCRAPACAARLDELAHERPVLVERGRPARRVLLERERQLGSVAQVAVARGTRRGRSSAERAIEMRRANGHGRFAYAPRVSRARPDRHRGRLRPAGTRGTSRPCGWRRPGRGSAIEAAAAGARPSARRYACRGSRPPASEAGGMSAAGRCQDRVQLARRTSPRRCAQGETRASQSASAFHMFPMPATSRCRSSSASPSSRFAVRPAQVAHHRVRAPVGSPSTSGPSRPQRHPRRELEHRPVPEHRLALRAAQHEPRPARRARARPASAPAARHAQVAAQDDAALEPEQQVLPDGVDRLQAPPVQRSATPLTAARGCGDSTRSRSPTSGWSRRAARCSAVAFGHAIAA